MCTQPTTTTLNTAAAAAAAMHHVFALQTAVDIDGRERHLSEFAGKATLVVNVASKCGFTDANYKGAAAWQIVRQTTLASGWQRSSGSSSSTSSSSGATGL
jgi:hypothetical protein